MQSLHDLLDGCAPFPEMYIEQVDIISPEVGQRPLDRHVHRFDVVADEEDSVRFGFRVTKVSVVRVLHIEKHHD